MFEKVKGEGTAAAQAKKAERAKVRASREDNTPESDERKHEEYEALTSIVQMFKMNE